MRDGQYNFLDKALHHLALNYRSTAELSFDMDQSSIKSMRQDQSSKRHVFVSGLARSGTTILMKHLYQTGRYRSLTYRDMPFVLAPNMWRRFTANSNQESELHERMHGDGIMVSTDSPEALEEVFWRVFAGEDYIKNNHLEPHVASDEILTKFRHYVDAIITSSSQPDLLYLSKNNNNILRLNCIAKGFPNALILIPFRDPEAHAYSLLNQHKKFSELQVEDTFARAYMNWLVHHEFGLDHKPFVFTNSAKSEYARTDINYWLELWSNTYEALARNKPDNAHFVCYEQLCSDPEVWNRIIKLSGLGDQMIDEPNFRLSSKTEKTETDQEILKRTRDIYTSLISMAL